MEEVISKNLRRINLDDGIHLCHGVRLRRRVGNQGGYFCTSPTSTISIIEVEKEG